MAQRLILNLEHRIDDQARPLGFYDMTLPALRAIADEDYERWIEGVIVPNPVFSRSVPHVLRLCAWKGELHTATPRSVLQSFARLVPKTIEAAQLRDLVDLAAACRDIRMKTEQIGLALIRDEVVGSNSPLPPKAQEKGRLTSSVVTDQMQDAQLFILAARKAELGIEEILWSGGCD